MPIRTYWEPEGFVFECSEVVTAQEIAEINFDFLNVPVGITPRYQLINAEAIDRFDLNELDLVNLSADDLSVSRKYPNIKVAMVSQDKEARKLFMDYIKISWAINTSWELRVFNTLEAAREWLNLPPKDR